MSAASEMNMQTAKSSFNNFLALCKPRVTMLIVFTAMIGMFLATPNMVPLNILLAATIGIGMASGAAAAFNCLVEQAIDAKMARTRGRPLPTGQVTSSQTFIFASIMASIGLTILYVFVNPLTMWLTLATFVGYAVIYTIFLKPATPLNIVIGGLSGAMPPALGWAAVTGTVSAEAWVLVLIIFAWTPPHFWALALYRREEYAKSGLPMLPVTHGEEYTRLQILLYTIILFVVTVLPFAMRMSGFIYLGSMLILNAVFMWYALSLYKKYSDSLARSMFKYSILYLTLIFAALLIDHYWLYRL
jgi:protoheme IX farnesyltransferase